MIRGVDTQGTLVLGITRNEVEGLLDGKLARLGEMFASGPIPVPRDLRTKGRP